MQIKICGIQTREIVETCLNAGADFLGFVHFAKSPRHLSLEAAGSLRQLVRGRAQTVVLLVNPDDGLIDQVMDVVAPDWIQLHGGETPERVAKIATRSGAKILKALQVNNAEDLVDINAYDAVSDCLLLDAKPAPDAPLPGGNGEAFDWDILRSQDNLPDFFLAGGLTAQSVGTAIKQIAPYGIDVSSSVEISRGVKDAQMIERFITQARIAQAK